MFSRCQILVCLPLIGNSQTAYKAVINDTTPASTVLFTVNVMGALGYSLAGEMRNGFTINSSGTVSTTQQLDIGRYEFVILAPLGSDISVLVGLVDVLSSGEFIMYSILICNIL